MTTYIIIGLIILLILYIISSYNNLVKNKNMVEEGWSGIDVQLKKRSNLIPNILSSVKGYMKHEKGLLEKITELRAQSDAADNVLDQAKAESSLSGSLMNLFAVAENYPELKANENFLDLQKQLQEIEDEIQMARRYYNGTVRNNNVLVESFPSNIIANSFNFGKSRASIGINKSQSAINAVRTPATGIVQLVSPKRLPDADIST